ncbi:hypothetical protein VOLCADRAFT_105473 [Volvox carteri f. nagariensis]|uniref:BZIP domain-containing protein n=1 Tax=Volvox carteri f. nagariensis TaxID=3068 RepID=D8U120_VOLCA|nr:uncharacterized protein VOLCADRAFT_105473 [Volvox carteri f. nagariensis]EFJ46482.1 hypothetical protein VOLCADRAFT_105473 [Volvox carteri f. nagariensis]|eukprot:XP_002952339.1 hypothetical protein VOLCADRAFT_105473 [Volvox carteri f. nagariensis]
MAPVVKIRQFLASKANGNAPGQDVRVSTPLLRLKLQSRTTTPTVTPGGKSEPVEQNQATLDAAVRASTTSAVADEHIKESGQESIGTNLKLTVIQVPLLPKPEVARPTPPADPKALLQRLHDLRTAGDSLLASQAGAKRIGGPIPAFPPSPSPHAGPSAAMTAAIPQGFSFRSPAKTTRTAITAAVAQSEHQLMNPRMPYTTLPASPSARTPGFGTAFGAATSQPYPSSGPSPPSMVGLREQELKDTGGGFLTHFADPRELCTPAPRRAAGGSGSSAAAAAPKGGITTGGGHGDVGTLRLSKARGCCALMRKGSDMHNVQVWIEAAHKGCVSLPGPCDLKTTAMRTTISMGLCGPSAFPTAFSAFDLDAQASCEPFGNAESMPWQPQPQTSTSNLASCTTFSVPWNNFLESSDRPAGGSSSAAEPAATAALTMPYGLGVGTQASTSSSGCTTGVGGAVADTMTPPATTTSSVWAQLTQPIQPSASALGFAAIPGTVAAVSGSGGSGFLGATTQLSGLRHALEDDRNTLYNNPQQQQQQQQQQASGSPSCSQPSNTVGSTGNSNAKNRDAQRRFRQRQREAFAAMELNVRELEQQLQSLRREKRMVEQHNEVLLKQLRAYEQKAAQHEQDKQDRAFGNKEDNDPSLFPTTFFLLLLAVVTQLVAISKPLSMRAQVQTVGFPGMDRQNTQSRASVQHHALSLAVVSNSRRKLVNVSYLAIAEWRGADVAPHVCFLPLRVGRSISVWGESLTSGLRGPVGRNSLTNKQ